METEGGEEGDGGTSASQIIAACCGLLRPVAAFCGLTIGSESTPGEPAIEIILMYFKVYIKIRRDKDACMCLHGTRTNGDAEPCAQI